MILIRRAGLDDIDELIRMGRAFHAALDMSVCDLRFNEDSLKATCEWLMSGNGILLIAEDDKRVICGTIAGSYSPWMLDFSQVMLKENWWWVEPDFRGTPVGRWLEESMCREAKLAGATHGIMGTRAGEIEERLARIYKRKGYKPLERHFIKEY